MDTLLPVSRKIPSIMFSQHPDHAGTPYWHSEPYIRTHEELEECIRSFRDLGAEEMMWDWEGKLVDDSVVERLLSTNFDFFKAHPLGKDLFLTFRVPNPRIESGYRLGRAFMIILASHHLAHEAGLSDSPLFEVILPMTESAGEMSDLQDSFERITNAAVHSFGSHSFSTNQIEVIPIFESVSTIMRSGTILQEYLETVASKGKSPVPYLRPFCARSDPALNSGIVPTTLAIKWALSDYAKLEKKQGIPLYPIIAPGVLPFRGGLDPSTAEAFIQEFPGVKTVVIQSAFRYDFPREEVDRAILFLKKNIPSTQTIQIDDTLYPDIEHLISLFEKPYHAMIEKIAPFIMKVTPSIPKRRERAQHIGLFGYSRQVGEIQLPRAIGFTAACYSLGIPPELFGTGRGIQAAQESGNFELLERLYTNLKPSLRRAGRYLRKASFKELDLPELSEEVSCIEDYLQEELGPQSAEEEAHARLVADMISRLQSGHSITPQIEQAALLRHSLG